MSPTGWRSCRCAGRRCRSSSAETRKLAEEWTYRYLAAAHAWARSEPAARARLGLDAYAKLTVLSGPLHPTANCALGRATTGSLSQIAAASVPRSTKHGATLTIPSGT